MSEAVKRFRQQAIERAVTGQGIASPAARRAAFDNRGVDGRAQPLVDKVVRHAWKVTAQDVEAARAAGVSEDEIFEMTVCAALGHATRQLDSALAALDAATAKRGRSET
jgi:hypothetical protein